MVKRHEMDSKDNQLTNSPNEQRSATPIPTTPFMDTKTPPNAQNISPFAEFTQDPPAGEKAGRKVNACTHRACSTHMKTGIDTTASRILYKNNYLEGRRQGDRYFPR